MSCPALQLQTSQKQKRSRFAQKTKINGVDENAVMARRLAQLLREKKKEFRGFNVLLDEFIAKVEARALRSRKSDVDKVMACLRAWSEGLTIKELMEDTGFSHWDIRQIVADLVKRGKVARREELRGGLHSKQRVAVYRLTQITSDPKGNNQTLAGKV